MRKHHVLKYFALTLAVCVLLMLPVACATSSTGATQAATAAAQETTQPAATEATSNTTAAAAETSAQAAATTAATAAATTAATTAAAGAVDGQQGYVKVDDPGVKLSISWLGWPNHPDGEEGGYIETLIEQEFNVDITPIFMDSTALNEKFSVMLAGGDIPDVIYNPNANDLLKYVPQGFYAPLPYDMLKACAPAFVNVVNTYAPIAWTGSQYEGVNYAIPTTRGLSNNSQGVTWRKDWLDNVGISKTPETLDEFHEAFYKFTHDDPDKNGQNDTYGLSGDMTYWYWSFGEVFGAYGLLPYNFMDIDGELIWGAQDPRCKEALALLAEWYKEGIIDPDFVTDVMGNEIRNKLINSKIGYQPTGSYSLYNLDSESSPASLLKALTPEGEFTPGLPPKGPYDQFAFKWGGAGNMYAFGKDVSPALQERVLSIWDRMLTDDEFYIQTKCGEQGVQWQYNDPDIGPTSGIKGLEPYVSASSRYVLQYDITYVSFFSPSGGITEVTSKYRDAKAVEFESKYSAPQYGRHDYFIQSAFAPRSAEFLTPITDMQRLYFAEVIRGEKSIDTYDQFLTDLGAGGMNEWLAEAKKLKDTADDILAEIGASLN